MPFLFDFQTNLAQTSVKGLDRDLAWVPTLPGPYLTTKQNIFLLKILIFSSYRGMPFYQNFKMTQPITKKNWDSIQQCA